MSKKRKKGKQRAMPGAAHPRQAEDPGQGAPAADASVSRMQYWPSRLLSNLRFSLTLRIALHYGGQLLRTTVFTLLAFTVAFGIALTPIALNAINQIVERKPSNGRAYSPDQFKDLPVTQAYYLEEPISDDFQGFLEKWELAFSGFAPGKAPTLALYTGTLQGGLVVALPLERTLSVYAILCWTLLCCDLYRMVYFLRKRSRLNARVLKPISDMADAAAALGANNLSDRISIEGTKNELKDLATVINLMLDRIERSYNSQKQFVSDASHELRTPIAVIQGYVNMLERWGKTDKDILDEGIVAISQETTAMKELVERLLFLARHDKKTLMLETELFDPTEVMSSVYRDAQLLSPAHQFALNLRQSAMVKGDKGMIKQLMRILVDNAIKYTPPGGRIALGMDAVNGECVLSVTDTGAGITAKELSRIFDRFYRSDKARKAQSSGHGLGLSIARIIVVAHGGKLNVRSKEGAGATFSVKLPVSDEIRQ